MPVLVHDHTGPRWEIDIRRDGIWPCRWVWVVTRRPDFSLRIGESFTKDRARRAALKAKRSMENDDVKVTYS